MLVFGRTKATCQTQTDRQVDLLKMNSMLPCGEKTALRLYEVAAQRLSIDGGAAGEVKQA